MGDPICEMCKVQPADTVISTFSGKEFALCDPCSKNSCSNCNHLDTYPSMVWKRTLGKCATYLTDCCINHQLPESILRLCAPISRKLIIKNMMGKIFYSGPDIFDDLRHGNVFVLLTVGVNCVVAAVPPNAKGIRVVIVETEPHHRTLKIIRRRA